MGTDTTANGRKHTRGKTTGGEIPTTTKRKIIHKIRRLTKRKRGKLRKRKWHIVESNSTEKEKLKNKQDEESNGWKQKRPTQDTTQRTHPTES